MSGPGTPAMGTTTSTGQTGSGLSLPSYIAELLPLLPDMTLDSLQCPNEDMDRRGKVIDLFGDGIEHSVLYFDENKAKKIVTKITEAD